MPSTRKLCCASPQGASARHFMQQAQQAQPGRRAQRDMEEQLLEELIGPGEPSAADGARSLSLPHLCARLRGV